MCGSGEGVHAVLSTGHLCVRGAHPAATGKDRSIGAPESLPDSTDYSFSDGLRCSPVHEPWPTTHGVIKTMMTTRMIGEETGPGLRLCPQWSLLAPHLLMLILA